MGNGCVPAERVLKWSIYLRAEFLPQHIDGGVTPIAWQVPEGPSVAAGGTLDGGADLMYRAPVVGRN